MGSVVEAPGQGLLARRCPRSGGPVAVNHDQTYALTEDAPQDAPRGRQATRSKCPRPALEMTRTSLVV